MVLLDTNYMMLAHATSGSMNWILSANLLVLWFVSECLAIAIGLRGIFLDVEKHQMRYAAAGLTLQTGFDSITVLNRQPPVPTALSGGHGRL